MPGLPTSLMETIAVICAILNVVFATRASNWNWLFGILSITLYTLIFFQVKLYADMSLQLFFLIMQGYGLYRWCLCKKHRAVTISHTPKWVYGILIFGGLTTYWILHYILIHYTDSTSTQLDAITTAYSFIGQWMMSEKWIEHWLVWVFVDTLSIQMYLSKSLYLTAWLYAIFLILCFTGYRYWSSQLHRETASLSHPSSAV